MHSFCKWGNWEIEKMTCASLNICRTDTEPIFQSRHSGYFPRNHSASCPLITAVGRTLLNLHCLHGDNRSPQPWVTTGRMVQLSSSLSVFSNYYHIHCRQRSSCMPTSKKEKKKQLPSYAAEIAQEIMPRKIFFLLLLISPALCWMAFEVCDIWEILAPYFGS